MIHCLIKVRLNNSYCCSLELKKYGKNELYSGFVQRSGNNAPFSKYDSCDKYVTQDRDADEYFIDSYGAEFLIYNFGDCLRVVP